MLWELNDLLAKKFIEMLRGEKPVRAGTLAVILDFLKMHSFKLRDGSSSGDREAYLEALSAEGLPFA
jgi:hypothetical protein